MDRPRFASWMIPLIMGYSLISAAMALPAIANLGSEDFFRAEPWILIGPATVLWFLLFWCGVGLLKAKRAALQWGLGTAILLATAAFASLCGLLVDDNALFLSSAVPKTLGFSSIGDALIAYIPWPDWELIAIHLLLTVIDLLFLILVIGFLVGEDIIEWTTAARKNEESENHGSP